MSKTCLLHHFSLGILAASNSLQPLRFLPPDNRVADGENGRYKHGESSQERANVVPKPLHSPQDARAEPLTCLTVLSR